MLLIYGAYGYTGELAARRAVERGLRPVLAGRDAARLAPLASSLGLEHRVFPLDDPRGVDAGLAGATVVLHCAGPFVDTWRPMAEGCLRARCHYLDVTGEIAVLAGLRAMGAEAERAGVMLLPGAGFDVVPTDCLAAHLAGRLPGAIRLTLAFTGLERISRGTARTMVREYSVRAGRTRQPQFRTIDLGHGPRRVVSIPWGDVYTAPISTGIADVAVYTVAGASTWIAGLVLLLSRPLARFEAVRERLAAFLARGAPGPSAAERARGRSIVWGEVVDGSGRRAAARLRLPDGYTLTALSAIEIASRALAGGASPGFRTPSLAFGPDLVLSLPGVTREDA
jgi:short subunit dehydrogenase-like uncharacterized protein